MHRPRPIRPPVEIARRLQAACAAFDPALAAHHARVADSAAAVARRLGLPARRIARIRFAAALHDVGKLGVPPALLQRKGRLTSQEMAVVRAHAEIGHRMLTGSRWPELRCAAAVALSHHEFWNGRGYPHGLRGDAIPLDARVVAVADVFDAMHSERTYKKAWTAREVLAAMRRERGTHFDPAVFDAFLAVMREPHPG